MKEQLIRLLQEFNKEANDPKAWEDVHGMSSKFAVKRFYEKYADRILNLLEVK